MYVYMYVCILYNIMISCRWLFNATSDESNDVIGERIVPN